MDTLSLFLLQATLIAWFTPRKLIAYAVVLIVIVVAVVWWMGRSRGRGTP